MKWLAELEQLDQYKLLGEKLPAGPATPNAERAAGLRFIQARRRELGAAVLRDERGESRGYAAMLIPELDRQVLGVRFPELNSKDRETRRRAWKKLMRDLGSVYGCDASIGKTKRNAKVIVR